MRSHIVRRVVAGLLIVAALALGARSVMPEQVTTVSLERRDLVRTLVLVGRVRSASRVRVGATEVGTARDVPVRAGDRVRAGQTLVVLDDGAARARVDEAAAALAAMTATTGATRERAEQEATLAQRDLERLRSVFTLGGMSRQEFEQAERRAADAVSTLTAARANSGDDGFAPVAQAAAALDGARAQLARLRLTAPAAGTVLLRDVEPGDAVQPGRTLLELALDGPTEIVVFPSEDNIEAIAPSAPATASADAYPERTFAARVSLIAPSVDPAQGTVEVRLAVPEPPAYLLPDMTLSVNIEAGRRPQASVLPEDAVRGLGTADPWVAVVSDGRLERKSVQVGLRTEGWIEITGGLAEDDQVVPAAGAPELGARVSARPATPAP